MPTPKETIAAYFASTRAMDAEAFVNTFAQDGVTEDPVGTPPMKGHEAIRGFITHVLSGFETAGLTEDNVFISGNHAAVKWTGRGRTKTGRDITFEGIDVIDCDEQGKIKQVRAFWDAGPVMAAMQG